MFTFFNRTPKIYVDNFTYLQHVYEYVPIIKASKAIPEWWKSLDRGGKTTYSGAPNYERNRNQTMKTCYGALELFKRGMILEYWADIEVHSEEDFFLYYYSCGKKPDSHPDFQRGQGFEKYHHLKLVSPWCTKEKTGVHFLYMGAEYSLDNIDIKVPPGILNFSWNNSSNFNFFFPKKQYKFDIRMGQPLAHIIPLSDGELVIKNHLISSAEYDSIKLHSTSSHYGWRGMSKMLERSKSRQADKKCPFGFGDKS